MEDQKYSLTTADPSGYWLIPNGVNDPKQWACMDSADPVKEIDDLRARLDSALGIVGAAIAIAQAPFPLHDFCTKEQWETICHAVHDEDIRTWLAEDEEE